MQCVVLWDPTIRRQLQDRIGGFGWCALHSAQLKRKAGEKDNSRHGALAARRKLTAILQVAAPDIIIRNEMELAVMMIAAYDCSLQVQS